MSFVFLARSATAASRRLLGSIKPTNALMLNAKRVMAGKAVQDIQIRAGETHDDKNLRLNRPCSPHLTIYAPQYTSMFSIVHRITGCIFSFYVFNMALCALFLPYSFEEFCEIVECQHLNPFIITFFKFALAFPICYHGVNGVRHLLWDLALFLSMKEVLITGLVMLSIVLTLVSIALFVV